MAGDLERRSIMIIGCAYLKKMIKACERRKGHPAREKKNSGKEKDDG